MLNKQLLKIIIPLVIVGNTGCSLFEPQVKEVDKLIYVTTPLPIPERPVLPTLTSSEMKCLSPQALDKLKQREILRKQYAEELEVIIRSTHVKK